MAKNLKYEWCSESAQSTGEFLGWIYDRLQNKLGDNLMCQHMRRLDSIIDDMPGVIPSKFDKMLYNNPELTKKREAFRQALVDLGHTEATTYTHWALEAFDKAHELR